MRIDEKNIIMARKKMFVNAQGEKVFERKIPQVGINQLEKETRPKNQKTPSQHNEAGIEKNLIAP